VLAELLRAGARLSVDDFGTGHSSLARLRSLRVHELKIDRSFTAPVRAEPADTAIVAAIVRMAHELGLDVVAEGVETLHQLHALRHIGCRESRATCTRGRRRPRSWTRGCPTWT
jgi:EAL domain-containing protein (putative c-di-GMP-specific phosphodiesterase class I)